MVVFLKWPEPHRVWKGGYASTDDRFERVVDIEDFREDRRKLLTLIYILPC